MSGGIIRQPGQRRQDMNREIAEKIKCVGCGGDDMVLKSSGHLAEMSVNEGKLVCRNCEQVTPILQGVIENSPARNDQRDIWDDLYSKAQGTNIQGQIAALERGFREPERLSACYPLVRMANDLRVPLKTSVELGSGGGAYSLVLRKLGLVDNVTLLDYSLESLRAARDLFDHFGESCTLVHSSIESHPFKKDAFDLSLSGGVIEHYRTPGERLACLKTHLEVADQAFIQAPVNSVCYWAQRAMVTVIKRGWPFGYENPVTAREMNHMAELAGARITRTDYHFFLAFLALRVPRFTTLARFLGPVWFTRPMRTELAVLLTRSG